MTTNLAKKARAEAARWSADTTAHKLFLKLADEIERLRAELAELKKIDEHARLGCTNDT